MHRESVMPKQSKLLPAQKRKVLDFRPQNLLCDHIKLTPPYRQGEQSSAHHWLEKFFELKTVMKYQCRGDPSLSQFIISEDKWDFVGSLVKFLLPLATVIKIIKILRYHTFSSLMPNYQRIVKQLERVSFVLLNLSSIITYKVVMTDTDWLGFLVVSLYRYGTAATSLTYKLKAYQC